MYFDYGCLKGNGLMRFSSKDKQGAFRCSIYCLSVRHQTSITTTRIMFL